jgi:predicted Zn-dependent protease
VACEAADRLALKALARLGYEPLELKRAYERLARTAQSEPDRLAPWEAAHGWIRERIAVAALAETTGDSRRTTRRAVDLELDLSRAVEGARLHGSLDAVELLLRRGLVEEARKLIEEVEASSTVRGKLLAGRAHMAGGNVREAERVLRGVLLRQPGSYSARLLLARLYLREGRRETARTELAEALRRAPFRAEVHLLLARASEDPVQVQRRLVLARDLDGPRGPHGRKAAAILSRRHLPATSAATPRRPPQKRGQILSGR